MVVSHQQSNGQQIVDRCPKLTDKETNAVLEIVDATVLRASADEGSGVTAMGTGVYLGDQLAATAYHVGGNIRTLAFTFEDGTRSMGTRIAWDKDRDVAVFRLENDLGGRKGAELANRNPRIGERIVRSGYGMSRVLSTKTGTIYQKNGQPSNAPEAEWSLYSTTAPVTQGDSGGPAYTRDGLLIGLTNWGDAKGSIITSLKGCPIFVKNVKQMRLRYGRCQPVYRAPAPPRRIVTVPPPVMAPLVKVDNRLHDRISELERQLAELQRQPGPKGDKGDNGDDGAGVDQQALAQVISQAVNVAVKNQPGEPVNYKMLAEEVASIVGPRITATVSQVK